MADLGLKTFIKEKEVKKTETKQLNRSCLGILKWLKINIGVDSMNKWIEVVH